MKKLLGIWYIITGKKKFRVKLYDDSGYTKLMTYQEADNYAHFVGGQVCIDFNKKLQP